MCEDKLLVRLGLRSLLRLVCFSFALLLLLLAMYLNPKHCHLSDEILSVESISGLFLRGCSERSDSIFSKVICPFVLNRVELL